MTKLIVVTGATGSQGTAVIKHFQKKQPAWRIRGLTRDPSSSQALALSKDGIEIVKADLEDPDSLKAAFTGAQVVFAYTNSNGIIGSSAVMGRFLAGELAPPIGLEAYKIELQQGRNIAQAAADVRELERLIWSDLADATKWSHGKYTKALHFDVKSHIAEHIFSFPGLKDKTSTLLMGSFMTNWTKEPAKFGLSKQPDGSLIIALPFREHISTPMVDVEMDTGPLVDALIACPAGQRLLGVTEDLTLAELASLLSSAAGVECQVRFVPVDVAIADDPTGMKAQVVQVLQFVDEFGYTGGDPDVLRPEQLEEKYGITIPRSKLADFFKRVDWAEALA